MKAKQHLNWRLFIIAAVTAASVLWVFWGIDPAGLALAARSYQLPWAALLLLVFSLTFVIRTWRFQVLLERDLPFRHVASVMAVSILAITVVPLRMGELVRPYLLADRYRVPIGAGLAAVVMERVLDLLAMVVLIAVTAALVELPGTLEFNGVDLMAVGQRTVTTTATVAVVGIGAVGLLGEPAVAFLARMAEMVSPKTAALLNQVGGHVVRGVRFAVSEPLRVFQSVLGTLGVWGFTLLGVAVAMAGMPGIQPSLDLLLANWTATMVGILLVPTPGFLGSFELASVASLEQFQIARDVATAWAVGLHVAILTFTVVVGMAALAYEGRSLRGLVRQSHAKQDGPGASV